MGTDRLAVVDDEVAVEFLAHFLLPLDGQRRRRDDEDSFGAVTGDDRDAVLYRVQLEDGTKTDVRWRDLRPF